MAAVTELESGADRPPRRAAPPTSDVVSAAAAAAAAQAAAAGIEVRDVTGLDGLAEVHGLLASIWRPEPNGPAVPLELLRALSKAGSYVVGAYRGTELVGACVGFFGPPDDQATLHSHIAGVLSGARGRGVGLALKWHQRAWGLARGVDRVTWTCDPLVSRNAYFNLTRLGARAEEYLPNFYGGVQDSINRSDATDRLLVRWDLAASLGTDDESARGVDAAAELRAGAEVGLDRGPDGEPVVVPSHASRRLLRIPLDVEQLRGTDPGLARAWRVALREALAPLMGDGARVVGFSRDGSFVLRIGGGDA